MTSLTQPEQKVKPVHTDGLRPNDVRPVSVYQQSVGHGVSVKEEIYDFNSPSDIDSPSLPLPVSIPSDESKQDASTAQKIELLYQPSPRRYNTFNRVKGRRDWRDSRETHENASRREYHLLITNPRAANHLITLKYLREFTAQKICSTWSILKALLKQQGIVAYVVVEITARSHFLPDGSRRYFPINKIHYHFLVDSILSARQLRDIFNRSCLDVGLIKNEFEVQHEIIPDRRTFEHKCEYCLKFNKFKDQAILFRPGTGINKVASIGRWFVNADGTRASKDSMWKSLVAGWYPKTAVE
jgi:hypothetical protein